MRLKILTTGSKTGVNLKIMEPISTETQISRIKSLIDYQSNRFSSLELYLDKSLDTPITLNKVIVESLQVRTNKRQPGHNVLVNVLNCDREEPVIIE